jgi:2,3-bisphosphoglycerate-independent phosphoglycerate mutase
MARREGVSQVYHHAMLGRRGEHLGSGAHYIKGVEEEMARLGTGIQASIIGRFWSLDREYNWDRIEKTYKWLVEGNGTFVTSP